MYRNIVRVRRVGNHSKHLGWFVKVVTLVLVLITLALTVWMGWEYRNRRWIGFERFTVLNIGDEVVVESFDPANGIGVMLKLPNDLEIYTIGGRGKWKIGVMKDLAKKYGVVWAADSVADFLGISYTAEKTQLSVWDRLIMLVKSREVKWRNVELSETFLVKEARAVDSAKVYEMSPFWRTQVREWFMSSMLSSEDLTVQVVNTTNESGLGNRMAGVLESAGVRVVGVENGSLIEEKCLIVGTSEIEKKKTVVWMKKYFGCSYQLSDERTKGDLELKLGNGYKTWRNGDD